MLKYSPLILILFILSCDIKDSVPVNEINPPEIASFRASPDTVAPEDTTQISVEMSFNLVDPRFSYMFTLPDGGTLKRVNGGSVSGTNVTLTVNSQDGTFEIQWIAPSETGSYQVLLDVSEKSTFRESVKDTLTIEVVN